MQYAQVESRIVRSTHHRSSGGALTPFTRENQALSAGIDYSHLPNGYLGAHNPGA